MDAPPSPSPLLVRGRGFQPELGAPTTFPRLTSPARHTQAMASVRVALNRCGLQGGDRSSSRRSSLLIHLQTLSPPAAMERSAEHHARIEDTIRCSPVCWRAGYGASTCDNSPGRGVVTRRALRCVAGVTTRVKHAVANTPRNVSSCPAIACAMNGESPRTVRAFLRFPAPRRSFRAPLTTFLTCGQTYWSGPRAGRAAGPR